MGLLTRRRSRRWVVGLAIAGFLVYTAWILGPYLQSVFVRDATVTSWARVATAPIDGEIVSEVPSAATTVGSDGFLAEIRNTRMFEEANLVAQLETRVGSTRVRLEDLRQLADSLDNAMARREAQLARYAELFRAELDSSILRLERDLARYKERLDSLDKAAAGTAAARQNPSVAEQQHDDLRQARDDIESDLAHAKARRSAADEGVFIQEDGSEPNWVQATGMALELEVLRVRGELNEATADYRQTQAELAAARADLAALSAAVVLVPPGAFILNTDLPEGATVRAGDVLARWVDCTVLLVDVPVSDAELPLIRTGMAASVILEGERDPREARVLMTRGSTATLDSLNLAAVAKGRDEGAAQVIVELREDDGPDGDCLVGRAAYVRFPDVGLIDVVRARLRL